MDDVEQQLRDGLQRLAERAEPDVDVDAVVAAGDGLRRWRWGRGAVVGLAVATGAVFVAWPVLAGRAVPAVPDPVASPTPSVSGGAAAVVSAELVYPGGRVEVFRDEARGVWGYRDYANDVRQTKPLDTLPVGGMFGLAATVEGDYFVDSTAIGLLPPGGTDPEFTFPHDAISWTSAILGDTGQIVFLVKADRIRRGAAMVDSITYTDPAGQRVSYDPYPSLTPPPATRTPPLVACEAVDAELLAAANRAGGLDDRARFIDGQMVQATRAWWFVAVKADVTDSEYARASGLNDQDLMVFATDAPSGGFDWIPLGTQAEWDGTTQAGEHISDWRTYRLSALGCAGPG